MFSLVSLTGKVFSEIKSFWYRDLNYRELTGVSSQQELIPDRRRLFCVMATASCFMVFCGYVTSLAWVKLWCKKRVVSVGVLAGKLLPGHVVQFPLLISSWVWGKDQLNACRRILHPFPCHSWLICQEAKTDKLHYSKREKMALSRFQSVSKSLLCLINLSRHCAWIVTNYTKNLSSTWIVRKVKAHLILVWFFFIVVESYCILLYWVLLCPEY